MKVLMKYGGDINVKYNDTITPLHIAVSNSNKDMINLLMVKNNRKQKKNTKHKSKKQNLSDMKEKNDSSGFDVQSGSLSNLRAHSLNMSENDNYEIQKILENSELLEILLREVTMVENSFGNGSVTDSFISVEPSIEPLTDNKDS